MAKRTSKAPAEDAAAEDEILSSSAPKLQFDETLAWRVGKPIAIADLLRRLETLAAELKSLPQGDVDKSSLIPTAKELAQQNLLTHKDKGVKALTACCLVDMLAICVPDAPFTPQQMQDIFNLIITHSIPALQDPSNPYHPQHLHVLHSLSEVKSIVLLADVPRPDALVRSLFRTCFDILANPSDGHAKHLEYSITGLLQSFIEESPKLQLDVVELILSQFLRADPGLESTSSRIGKRQAILDSREQNQSHLMFKQLPPAYNVAKSLCNSCAPQLARPISLYFNQIIVGSATSRSNDQTPSKAKQRLRSSTDLAASDDENQDELSEDDLKQLERAHRLLKEIWRSAPRVLQGVVPQVEAELSRDNVEVRLVATDAIGDMVSGVGAAGSPTVPLPDPATYPPLKLSSSVENQDTNGAALSSAISFAKAHPSTYQQFVGRRNDKAPEIRAVWALKVGNILSTSAGGLGLSTREESFLSQHLSQLLVDSHDSVRAASIRAAASLDFQNFITRFGATAGVDSTSSVLHNLADRVRDRKQVVRNEATRFLARLWGVGYGELLAENEKVEELLDPIPSKILNVFYANDPDIHALIDQVLFESLLPIDYPKIKKTKLGDSQPTAKQQTNRSAEMESVDKDMIRVERLLLLYTKLDQRAKPVMLALMVRSAQLSEYMRVFLKRCEDYNGGIVKDNAQEIKQHLGRLIDFWAKSLPDPSRAAEDLWKFAKLHDRRCYGLIRFCMADDSDYNKVHKSIKELTRRLEESSSGTSSVVDTMRLLVMRVSNLYYNRSHIHPIIEFSRNEHGKLAPAAHELLKEISAKKPGVFKAHGKELCQFLEDSAPRNGRPCEGGTLDALKACASFAAQTPAEMPKDKKFLQAMLQYALQGTPAATAKYAVSIILSSTDKKEMYASEIVQKCAKGFSYGSTNFLAKLASLSQVMRYASSLLNDSTDIDPVMAIAIEQVLSQFRTPTDSDDSLWQDTMDTECEAKVWALKIIVNRLRSFDDAESVQEIGKNVYKLLNNLIVNGGELNNTTSTPSGHKSRLRLHAGLLLVKLSSHQDLDALLTPQAFNNLALVAQDPNSTVRELFVNKIKKYLGQDRLPSRFYTIIFLLAFEPTRKLQRDSQTWLKARTISFAKAKKPTMEQILSRLLSLLAHHPDFNEEDLERKVRYILFYLEAVASPDNLSLLYHIAQRVKTVQDGMDETKNAALYYLSDLTAAVITQYGSLHNWSLESYVGKVRLPSSVFAPISNNDLARRVAAKQYLPSEDAEQVEHLVRSSAKSKKRKLEDDLAPASVLKKRPRAASDASKPTHGSTTKQATSKQALPLRKSKADTPNSEKLFEENKKGDDSPSAHRRRSGRITKPKSYAEGDNEVEQEAEKHGQETSPSNGDGSLVLNDATDQGGEAEITSSSPTTHPKQANTPRRSLRSRK